MRTMGPTSKATSGTLFSTHWTLEPAEEMGMDGARGGPTLDWVILCLEWLHCKFRIFSLILSLSLSMPLLLCLSLYKHLSVSLYHFATDDDMTIHIENSGKKSLFALRHRLSIMKIFFILCLLPVLAMTFKDLHFCFV